MSFSLANKRSIYMSHACGDSASELVYILLYVLLDKQGILHRIPIMRPFIFYRTHQQSVIIRRYVISLSILPKKYSAYILIIAMDYTFMCRFQA